jgi:hypothetical protein
MTIDVRSLFTIETAAGILQKGLEIAQALGVSVSSWRTGDPTRSLYVYLADVLAEHDEIRATFTRAGFLSSLEDNDWADVHAAEVFGVERTLATPSTPTITVQNSGGGLYEVVAGDLTFRSSTSQVTFHNTAPATIAPGGGLVVLDLVADIDGSDSTVATDDVDEFVTPLLGVGIVSSTASVGIDKQDLESLKQDCRDTRGALSPNGPPDAYEYVVRNETLTGVTTITRSRSTSDSPTGQVTVYCAGPDGPVSGPSVTAAQAAIDTWATPLTITATAVSASAQTIDVTAVVDGDSTPADFAALVEAALQARFALFPIADEGGATVFRDGLFPVIRRPLDPNGSDSSVTVTISAPAADVAYTEGEVPVLGVVTITEA